MSQERISRGFSLVEIMVGMAVAIIGLLIIAGVLAVTSRQKEVTASGADAQTSGAIATYLIERNVRMAGYGMNFTPLLGCVIHAYDEGVSPAREFTFSVAPVVIAAGTAGAYGTPDTITVSYSTSDVGFAAPRLTQTHNGNNANYKVDNRFGFHEGDVVVVSEDGVDSDADGADDCTLAQVTGVPGTPGQTDNLIHNSGNYTNALGQNVPARYNKPGGLGIAYSTSARLYNLGALPANITYSVDPATSQLMAGDSLVQAAGAADNVAENIVFLRAQYGKDTIADTVTAADLYDRTTPVNAAGWQQVVALRLAVVARSRARDGKLVSPATLTLLPQKTMPNGTVIAAETLVLTDEQRRYRYKVFRTIVPLRSQIWRLE